MKILVFSGTSDGRRLSRKLADSGAEVTVCVATDYGMEEQGTYDGVRVLTGRRNADEMATLMTGYALCIDATHPYAVLASDNIRSACEKTGVPYRRLLRSACDAENAIFVSGAAEAAAALARTEGNILLAIGSKELSAFCGLNPVRLFPRVLPSHDAIAACEAADIPHRNIIAMQGPFTRELNTALIRQKNIAFLVTKDGGKEGGFPEKAAAAKETGVVLIVLRRPEEEGVSMEQLAAECEVMIRCS